jgi:steroid 5-alpha reductase family enzyme
MDRPTIVVVKLRPLSHSRQSAWWSLGILVIAVLFILQAPAIVCFAATALLAMIWCWRLDAEDSRAAMARGSVGDDRHLHVAGEADDALDEAATEEPRETVLRMPQHEDLRDAIQSREAH